MAYRLATEDDLPFVISSWSRSYKTAHTAGLIDDADWSTIMHAQIRKIVGRADVTTIVDHEGDFLFGFICGRVTKHQPAIVHYVYVKAPYRSVEVHGVRRGPRRARGMFAALGVDPRSPFLYSCKTSVVAQIKGYPKDGGSSQRQLDKIPRAKFVPAAGRYEHFHFERSDPHDHQG